MRDEIEWERKRRKEGRKKNDKVSLDVFRLVFIKSSDCADTKKYFRNP
jgi:hypothetical protein